MNIFIFTTIIILNFEFIFSKYIEESHHFDIIDNFAFGSCFIGRLSTRFDIFKTIEKNKPQLWIWLGDAAYADNLVKKNGTRFNYRFSLEMFNKSKLNEYYQKFISKTPVIGVWDDHDYCINDGNGYFEHKIEAKKLYLDYIDEKLNSPRRDPLRGIYATYSFGELNSHRNFRVILLDVRYNKSSYFFDEKPDILGEDQWNWFENILMNCKETFIFIGSGSQILPFDRILTESWYYHSRKRLFELIGKYKKSGVLLMSGDIHQAQILRTPCELSNIGYNLYEVTSSGLSHFYKFGFVFDNIFPNMYNFRPTIDDYNFAKISFDWGDKKEESKVRLEIIDVDNVTRLGMMLTYSDLKYNRNFENNKDCDDKINSRFKSFNEYFNYYTNNKIQFLLISFVAFGLVSLFVLIFFITYIGLNFVKNVILLVFQNIFNNHPKKE